MESNLKRYMTQVANIDNGVISVTSEQKQQVRSFETFEGVDRVG